MSTTRPLTVGEIKMAQSVFGDSIDYSQVKVHSGRLMGPLHKENFAKTTLSHIFMHNLYQDDFSKSPYLQDLFIHEMAHVWQYQQRTFAPTAIDLRNSIHYTPKAYEYDLSDKKDLLEFGTEQQASIIAAYFVLKQQNNPADRQKAILHKKVLGNFLKNPSYAKYAGIKLLAKKLLSPPPPKP